MGKGEGFRALRESGVKFQTVISETVRDRPNHISMVLKIFRSSSAIDW